MTTKGPGDSGGVEGALSQIAKRRLDLNRLDNEYAALITRAEEGLRSLGVGVRFSTHISSEEIDEVGETFVKLLAFDKIGGAWRLAIWSGDAGDPPGWDSTPLASTDRDMRFSVFRDGHLEKLILEGIHILDREVAAREQHLARSEAMVAAIEDAKGKRGAK